VTAAVAAWALARREHVPTARPFVALLTAQMLWTAAHLGEALAQTRDGKLWWDSVQNLPFAFMPPAYVVLATRFAGVRTPRGIVAAIAAVGGTCGLVLATAPLHGWARADAHLTGAPPVLTYALDVWDLGLATIGLGCLAVASAIVMRRTAREHRLYAAQSVTVAVAFGLPPLGTLLAMSLGLTLDGDRDVSPLTFMLGTLVAAWGLIRHRLLDVAPIARDAVMARLPDPVVVIDAHHRIVDANPAALEVLGAAERDVIGQLAAEALTRMPSVAPLLDAATGAAEVCHAGPRGVRWYEAVIGPLTDPGGHVVGSLLMLRDITARKQASAELERELARSGERFRALFDQVVQLTGILDRDGRVLAANRAALALIDRREDELIGQLFWETPWWTEPSARAQIRDAVTRGAAGEASRFTTVHRDAQGGLRQIDFSLTPVRDADGRVVELIPEGRDVTDLTARQRAATPDPHGDATITVTPAER